MPSAVAYRRAGGSVPSCSSSNSNSCRRTYTGRSPDGNGSGSCGSIQLACQSAGSSSPVSNDAGSDHDEAPDSVQTRTRHDDRLSRPQRLERPRNEHVVRGFEPSRPTIAELDFVGALLHRPGGQPPRQPWSGLVDPECRSVQVFDAQPVGEVHLERSIRSTLFALNNNLYTRSKFVSIRILLALSGASEMCVHCTSGRRGATASRGGLQ